MSSQDGSNRSQGRQGRSRQPGGTDPSQRRSQRWDVDPAEIDRYLSGRPTRSEEASARPTRERGNTADQLSRLQNAVGRRPQAGQPAGPSASSRETYRAQPAPQGRTPARQEPASVEDDNASYDELYRGDAFSEDDDGDAYDERYDEDEFEDEVAWEQPQSTPSPRQRTTRVSRQPQGPPRRQAVRRAEPDPLDVYDSDDDEFYNDDPYLGYEDEQIDRRPPRAAHIRARPRQPAKISRPNLPKMSVPKSVSSSPLLADTPSLVVMGAAIVSVALMAFLVSDRISLLGESIPTHVSASGDPENLQTRDAVWNIPLLAGMIMLMNMAAAWFISRIDRFASRFLLAAGLLVHFIAWVALFKYLWE